MQVDRPIAIAIILFIVILLSVVLVLPEYRVFTSLREDLGIKTAEYNAEYDYYAAIEKTYYELKNQEDSIKKIDSALPEDSNLGNLVYFFQRAALESGMLLKDVVLSKVSTATSQANAGKKDVVNEIIFSVDILGDYTALSKFLSAMEKSARIFEVTNISFSSAGGGPAPVQQGSGGAGAKPQFQVQRIYNFNLEVKTHSY